MEQSGSDDDTIPSLLTWQGIKSVRYVVLALVLLAVGFSIAVGWNVHRAVLKNHGWFVRSEVEEIATALAGLRSDAGIDLSGLFAPVAFASARHDRMTRQNLDTFEASVEMYTVALTALLRHGRDAAQIMAQSPETIDLSKALEPEYVKRLGSGYCNVPDRDPWGSPYRIFVGPWPEEWGPTVFRVHENAPSGVTPDALSVALDRENGTVGLPAPADIDVYVWSIGLNGVSDQAIFDPTHQYAAPARKHYRLDARDKYLGGGDDIGNWDRDDSWSAFYARR